MNDRSYPGARVDEMEDGAVGRPDDMLVFKVKFGRSRTILEYRDVCSL
jgi:hypothetical protein